MAIYMPPSLRRFEPRRIVFSTWMDHLPFAYDLIEAVRPGLLVELGTYNGLSYFAFCQAMKEFEVDGLCYAVDSWEGDAHTDAYKVFSSTTASTTTVFPISCVCCSANRCSTSIPRPST